DGIRDGHVTGVQTCALPISLALFIAAPVAHAAATFTASLDRDTIAIGENATLTLTVQDGTPADIPAAPNVPNLSVNYLSQSSQFNIVNGKASSTFSYNFLVRPAQPGDYTIPAINVPVDGKTLSSQPLKLKVLKSGAAT